MPRRTPKERRAGSVGLRRAIISRVAIPPEVESTPPARRFGKFVPVERLGKGGMGEVWKAWDMNLNRWVALKFLLGRDDDEIARFKREAHTAGKLAHANIAAVYEVGEDQGRHYIAMQFIDGVTLDKFPKSDRRALVAIVRDAARALAHAHEHHVIHRDLKPENLMVAAGPKVFLMDFGLARPIADASNLTRSSLLGTPQYMSPEQAAGRTLDAGADIYSLGATLYEVLADRPLFTGDNAYEVILKVQQHEPKPPRVIDPTIDPDLETIVLKCLEKERLRRYPTAQALARDLDRWLAGEPIGARPASTLYKMRKFIVRHRAVLIPSIVAVTAVALLVAGLAATSLRIRHAAARARDFEKDGRLEEARDAWRVVLESDPENCHARVGFQRTDRELKRRAGALAEAAAAGRAKEEAVRLVEQARPLLDQAHQSLYDAAFDPIEAARRADAAQRLLEEAVGKAPEMVAAHHLLGAAWELKGWDDKAEACWRRAASLDASFCPSRYRLGRLLLSRAFLARFAISPAAMAARGVEAHRLAQEAAGEFEAAMAGSGLDDPMQRALTEGMLAYARDDYDRVRQAAAEGVARFAGRPGVEEFFWLAGIALPDPRHGLDALGRALAARPQYPLARLARAACHKSLGDADAMIEDTTAALAVHPRLAAAWVYRAVARTAKGDVEATIADYAEALKVDPKMPDVWINRGNARMRKGDLSGAASDYTEALKLDPSDFEAFAYRSNVRHMTGDRARAVQDLKECLRLAPADWPLRSLAEGQLREMEK